MPDYSSKRRFESTPEPAPAVSGDVDPTRAKPGTSFVIHQHYATRLHFDLRLEMMNGEVPVLVSWAVPKNLPRSKGKPHLAIHVEDHPYEYGSFSGSIPAGNYGAGEVRIFDSGPYEVLEQEKAKLTFRLNGGRLRGVYFLTRIAKSEKDEWLSFLKENERAAPEPLPDLAVMTEAETVQPFDDAEWLFEPKWTGERVFAVCSEETAVIAGGQDVVAQHKGLDRIHERTVCLDCVLDGVLVPSGKSSIFFAFDILYLDGVSIVDKPLEERRELLEMTIVASDKIQVTPQIRQEGTSFGTTAAAQGLEALIAKRADSRYRPGRSADWKKVVLR